VQPRLLTPRQNDAEVVPHNTEVLPLVLVDAAALGVVLRAHRNRKSGRICDKSVASRLGVSSRGCTGESQGDNESADEGVFHF